MRLIEGEELKQIVIGVWNDIDRYVEGDISLSDIIGIIDDMPTIEPEIVRCKDCKNRGDDDCPMRFIEWVEYDDDGYIEYDDIIHDYTKDDGFCDRAERRTDEQDSE